MGGPHVEVVDMDQLVGMALTRRRNLLRYRGLPGRSKSLYAAFWSLALMVVALASVVSTNVANAAPATLVPSDASCAVLSRVDPGATNGGNWGKTILAGHNVPGGWFGVDVCANGTNTVAPNGSNVSCDRVPSNWAATGCAPGVATSDGYGLTYQCVELVIRFSAWAYGDSVGDWGRLGWGNAPDLWLANNHPNDFVMYPNGSTTRPVPGDILVWGSVDAKGQPTPAGPDGEHGGHIAVVAAVRGNTVVTAEQNVKWGNQDHPSDTLALTEVGGRWILSGSTAHETTLPTYRWRPTMGTSRATYGWLHSVKNTGQFPSKSGGKIATVTATTPRTTPTSPSTSSSKPTQTPPKQSSGGLPALDQGVFVTNGVLSDLVWSTGGPFDASSSAAAPTARTRSLGAPPGVALAAGQRPAVVTQSDGVRYVYVVGANGHMYEAETSSTVLGVQWKDLGASQATALTGSASATLFTGGIALAALGGDGNLWWRAGPAGNPGGWLEIDHPANTTFDGSFALVAAPGIGEPMVVALGKDGVLYRRVWQPAMIDATDGQSLPADWSDWTTPRAAPAGVRLIGPLLPVYEATSERASVAPWLGTPLELLVADNGGHLWSLRATNQALDWTEISLGAPPGLQSLLAVTVTQSLDTAKPTGASPLEMRLYANTASGLALGAVALPQRGVNALGSASWTELSRTSVTSGEAAATTALAIGPGESALLIASRSTVAAVIDSSAAQILQPSAADSAQPASAGVQQLTLGSAGPASTFNDSFTSSPLDPRWSATSSGVAPRMTASGLQLATGGGKSGALLQSAAPGDTALEVRVALPSDTSTSQRFGLVLYLDDSNWMTLTLDSKGNTSYCVMVAGNAVPCMTQRVDVGPSSRVLWLQLARSGDTYSALASPDHGQWALVGQWRALATSKQPVAPSATPSATPAVTPAPNATPTTSTHGAPATRPSPLFGVASLGFTKWGVYAQGDSARGAATFADFVVAQLPVNMGSQ